MVGKDKARVYITVEKNFLALLRKTASKLNKTLSQFIVDMLKAVINK